MRIEKLTLKQFRSHHDTTIELDRFNFITGANAVGKSSIAMAIEYALTGRCQVTDAGGRGAEDLIRIGGKQLEVSALIEGFGEVRRIKGPRSHTLEIGGQNVELTSGKAGVSTKLGVSGDVLAAVLSAGKFISMPETEQKKLLAQVLASEAPVIPEAVLQDMKREGGILRVESIADIDAAYKHFYEARTETNREIKALGEMEAPVLPKGVPAPEVVRKQLDTLRQNLTSLTSENIRAEERYQADVRMAESKRAGLTAKRKEAARRQLTVDEAETLTKVAKQEDKANALRMKISELEGQVAAKERELGQDRAGKLATQEEAARNLRALIAAKDQAIEILVRIKGAECPTCQRALPAKDKAALGLKLDGEVAALRSQLQDIEATIADLKKKSEEPDAIVSLRQALARRQQELEVLGDIPAAQEALRKDREAVVEVNRCDRELAAIKAPELPQAAETNAEIETLTGRIAKGEEILEQVKDVERARVSFDGWRGDRHRLDERVRVLERLIEFFGPSGIKAQMVGDKIGPFTEQMNDTLAQFGYQAGFSLEPYQFSVSRDNDLPRSLRQLSESEAFRFGVAFQIALAMATGLKFVVIDRADILDSSSRSALNAMLLQSNLDQAIVLATTEKDPPAELPEGVKFIQLGQKQAVAA